MKKLFSLGAAVFVAAGLVALTMYRSSAREERLRFEREETELIVSNSFQQRLTLFKAGAKLDDATPVALNGEQIWLPKGNYFLQVDWPGKPSFYPVPIIAYRNGPDRDGGFIVTIRAQGQTSPPRLSGESPEFAFIPSGHFLFGDRLRIQEPHYVWLPAFFVSTFEVTNGEFREFMSDPAGFADDANWTAAGKQWKAENSSHATALLKPEDKEFKRFGQPDQPVVEVNWFEASAFCRWLTRKIGAGKWIFSLPSEAEWEKVARGPDNFDYGLGMTVSDNEVRLYNWKKNPGAEVTVVGWQETQRSYRPNRYGVYHITGNVAEWTQSVYRSYSRQHPYVDDDDRNHDDAMGERVMRGGSWYTASIAVLYIPYRENFQPAVQTPYLGFRIVARPLP